MITIHAIKRDSDGEIFSIGDKIKPIDKYQSFPHKEDGFIVEEIRIIICSKNGNYCYLNNKNGGGVRLDCAEKVKDEQLSK